MGFAYSNDDVYATIKEIRFNNCLQKHPGGHKCSELQSCETLYKMKLMNGCKDNLSCQSDLSKKETKIKTFKGCKRRLPRAIIIGAYKSGTRELIDFLAMNPLIVIKRQPKYEVAYFDKHVDKGLDWYRDEMPFSTSDQITIEKSPSYFTSMEAPRRIYEMDKNMKLILIVRDPVERTISHLTFEEFILKEQYGNSINNCLYKRVLNRKVINENCFAIKASFYDAQLKTYLRYFSLEQIHIVDADDFQKHPCKVIRDLEAFLDVDRYINCDNFLHNKNTGFYCVRTKNTESGFCYERTRGRLQMQTEFSVLKDQLKTLFKPHNEIFFNLIRKIFHWS
ncbi:heparan sulfate glucosamine 3-O-sulfotransferase 1-like [Mercenaria mercenaria]|uniref:heparan sulfate glucosamine 3-O-sulfotransferase 1-like n=1 Tax=Mercenaria mercenaria TaxID=6596 RepID=UPI00234EC9D5|nr:heparan sulfate glucosamine 3-O-sulfotransferase 1-like [Mercenaria mercenaria]